MFNDPSPMMELPCRDTQKGPTLAPGVEKPTEMVGCRKSSRALSIPVADQQTHVEHHEADPITLEARAEQVRVS